MAKERTLHHAWVSGRIRHAEHEGGALGHTIARHVSLSPAQLIARFSDPRSPKISSTFKNLMTAELVTSEVLSIKKSQLTFALKYFHARTPLVYAHRFWFPIGTYVEKGSTVVKKAYGVRLVIRPTTYGGKLYYIVTAFPTPSGRIMDADMSKSCEMDNLVVAYFGQDCDIFDPDMDFDNLLNEYLATSHPFNLRMLLANIQEFEQEPDGLAIFSERYKHDFWPDRWDMTAEQWIGIVKERVINNLHTNGHSSELSHF